ncbi:MAG TPA: hypothetical protein VF723_01875 [Pyrinomonadaceae bacterium]|jgi:hypothetical protein
MFQAPEGHLRRPRDYGLRAKAPRLLCALALALLLPVAASAYTVVLRSGRRIEIPAQFSVTRLTLTYESAPGINVTLLMSTIDIAATERANKEGPGALLRRAGQQSPPGQESPSQAGARARGPRRELTKEDIEAARLAREQSEQAYERRRIELGLPSREETRRRAAEQGQRALEESRRFEMETAEAESYWRERALELRAELTALDAQVNYVRARLSELPEYSSVAASPFITGVVPVFPLRGVVNRVPVVTGHPGFMRGTGEQVVARVGFGGGAVRGRIWTSGGGGAGLYGQRAGLLPGLFAQSPYTFGMPYGADYSAERSSLLTRLYDLEAARAGLQARWRLLEDQARRAGAPPGWLRP